ncbi:DUF493 domain-containing protein [Marinomonas sp. 42_23_T18]|nr:DUF493 domain-containing protein [Marinomonas sp. 42_23_T18]
MALIKTDGENAVDVSEEAVKIVFPCENYMVKVVALDAENILEEVTECVQKHAPEVTEDMVTSKRSSKARFISFTYRILATGEPQLAALHKDLMAHAAVKMVI